MSALIRIAELKDAAAMGRINVDAWRSTYTGLIDQAVLDSMTYEAYIQKWERHLRSEVPKRFMLVAEVDAEVVGYASGGPNRVSALGFDSELYALYLKKEFQGKGIGNALFASGLRFLQQQGFRSMSLYVLASNTVGRKFYDRYNPDVRENAKTTIEGKDYCDFCYGWHSITSMLEQ